MLPALLLYDGRNCSMTVLNPLPNVRERACEQDCEHFLSITVLLACLSRWSEKIVPPCLLPLPIANNGPVLSLHLKIEALRYYARIAKSCLAHRGSPSLMHFCSAKYTPSERDYLLALIRPTAIPFLTSLTWEASSQWDFGISSFALFYLRHLPFSSPQQHLLHLQRL